MPAIHRTSMCTSLASNLDHVSNNPKLSVAAVQCDAKGLRGQLVRKGYLATDARRRCAYVRL